MLCLLTRAGSAVLLAVHAAAQGDEGYELLFRDATAEFENKCVDVSAALPPWITGDFIIPSVGKMGMGHRDFVGFLDAFGKMQKFRLSPGRVCATYRMMETKFYNDSLKAGTVAPGMLFWETDPPRHCPFMFPQCNLLGGNDNTYVNTMKIGDTLLSMTDMPNMLELDPQSMRVTTQHNWEGSFFSLGDVPVALGGTAHPVRHPTSGDVVAFECNVKTLGRTAEIHLYSVSDSAPTKRKLLTSVEMDTLPYMHSFGITDKYAVLPRMPVEAGFFAALLNGKAMHSAFKDIEMSKEGPSNSFFIMPLDGGAPVVKFLPVDRRLYYAHVVNTFQNGSEIVMDICSMGANPFAGNSTTVSWATEKSVRNAKGGDGPRVERFHLPLDPVAPVTIEALSNSKGFTDFPNINSKHLGKKYCFFWGVQWFTDPAVYATMAIVKYDVCKGGAPVMWRRDNWFPSEPTFVASPVEGAAEDEGVLMFTALDGPKGETNLVLVDAQSMVELGVVGSFPRIGFTTHGKFYPAAASQRGSEVFI